MFMNDVGVMRVKTIKAHTYRAFILKLSMCVRACTRTHTRAHARTHTHTHTHTLIFYHWMHETNIKWQLSLNS